MKRSLLVCVLAISAFSRITYAQCASPGNVYSFDFNGHTYKIVKEKQTWTDASNCAVVMGGKLTEITSQEENDTIFSSIAKAGVGIGYSIPSDGGGATYLWIGATDKHNEGVWLWDGDNNAQGTNFWNGQGATGDGNGEGVVGQYNNWGGTSVGGTSPNEPDDFIGTQDCGAIALDFWPKGTIPPYIGIAGEWNDLNVTDQLYYIVEKNCLDKSRSRDTSICKGEEIFLGGQFRSTGGVYVDSFKTPLGCDSVVTTTLSILGVDATELTATICQGDTLVIGGIPRTTAGRYETKFTSSLGCDSIVATTITVIPNVLRSRTTSICFGDSVLLGGSYRTQAGSYQDVYPSAAGCDSIVTTTLVVNSADTSVSSNGTTLTANASGATYQWVDCNNGNTPISGETGQSFTAKVSGRYAVIVTQNGCVGMSSCYAASPSSVLENNFPSVVSVYPNPAKEQVTINLGKVYNDVVVRIQTLNGSTVQTAQYLGSNELIVLSIEDLASGTYFLQLASESQHALIKLIKE